MHLPTLTNDEQDRLRVLQALRVFDTAPSAELDSITRTCSRLFGAPIALVSLVDERRQWFKSCAGLDFEETPRDVSFCAHAIHGTSTMVVNDASVDPRFHDNPLVLRAPFIRFYAGHPIRSRQGLALGTLCVIDTSPRAFSEEDGRALADLASLVEQYFRMREADAGLDAAKALLMRTTELDEALAAMRVQATLRQTAQRELRIEKERFEYILQNTVAGFVEIDDDDRIVSWNRSAETIFGWSHQEVVGRTLSDTIIPMPRRVRYRQMLRRLVDGDADVIVGQRIEVTGMRRCGEAFPLEITLNTTRLDGRVMVNAFAHDISRRKEDERIIQEMNTRLRTITDNLPAMIAYIDRNLRYRFHNRAYAHWFGIAENGLIGTDARQFWGKRTYRQLRPSLVKVLLGEQMTVEYQLHAKHGPMWFYANLVPHIEAKGKVAGFYLLAQDVSERQQRFQQIEHEATHDPLTGLPNRRALMGRLAETMVRVSQTGHALTVLFMDLDGFKRMNDTLGHEFGDAVLRRFSGLVSSVLRERDFLARLAGDEFVLLLEDVSTQEQIENVARSILDCVGQEQEVLGVAVRLSTSIGAAIHDWREGKTPQELLSKADSAMYAAKAKGKHCLSF